MTFLNNTLDLNGTSYYSTTSDAYESTWFFTTDEAGNILERVHSWFTGFRITMLYLGLNSIILVLIVLGACHVGAKKAKQAKEDKRNQRAQQEQYKQQEYLDEQHQQLAPNQDEEQKDNPETQHMFEVQLSARPQPSAPQQPGSVHSADSHDPSEYERKQHIQHLHGAVSSLGTVGTVTACCGGFLSDIMNRSFIYSAFLVHAWDQGSDFGVIYTWFTEDDGKWRYLGWISIGIVINYRLFSAYSLRKAQRGWRDTILQVLDIQLFVDVFRSFEEAKPTDSLYWIRAMEAVLESCLQLLLQFVYLYSETNPLVWLSLFGSLTSVIFSLLHYTDVVFVFDTSYTADTACFRKLWLSVKWYIAYISRFLFRLCEVTSRCMVLALIWSTWNVQDADDDIKKYRGAFIVGGIIGTELIFYALLTQMRIPPWELAAFLVVNIDLTLTFEGRRGALTKPLRHNPFYICICKPVAEMFTHVTDETEQYYDQHNRALTDKHSHHMAPWMQNIPGAISKNERNLHNPQRQKLLIAPAHYVYRFLEEVFELFCVLTFAVVDPDIAMFLRQNSWTVVLATLTTVCTPILYCTIRAFADESKTLERNLIAMVHHGDKETKEIIKLIGAGASLTQTDYEGNNIVHACIIKKNDELLKRLLKKYTKHHKAVGIDLRNKKGYTPVLLAAQYGAVDCLKLLQQSGIDFNQVHVYSGQALVHIATEYDQLETVEYLASLGDGICNVHGTYAYITASGVEIKGYNAIHVAARYNSVQCLDVLLGKDMPEPILKTNAVDFRARLGNGDTAAIVAASRGHAIVMQQLFDAGDYLDTQGNFGHTPLYRAALNNHPGTVLLLGRDFNANPNIVDENGVHVVIQCFRSFNFSVLSSLAELGCRFDALGCAQYLQIEIKKKDSIDDKLTPLMWACKYEYPKLVKTLLDSGADINHQNRLHETAAHHGAAMGCLDCLQILHQYKANFNVTNGAGQTPKDKAIQQHQKAVIEWFDELE